MTGDRAPVRGPILVLLSSELEHPGMTGTLEQACRLCRSGTLAVVLRDKEMSVRRRLLLGRRLREATRSNGQLFVVAQRVDLAIALGAEGIHLPAGGLLPSEVERLADFSWVSRAHHGLEALGDAEVKRLSHVFVSPVMADRKGRAALGLAGFRARAASLAVRNHQLQVCALGGVTAATCASLQAAGAGAVCVMGGVCVPGELEGLVRALGIERGSQSE